MIKINIINNKMEIDKDTYEYMLNFADDKTILNMLSVNKKFNDESFFMNIMMKKYPHLINYRKNNETWKHLFLRMVYYISKIQEEFDIPYINIDLFDPEAFYEKYKNLNNESALNEALNYAARKGDVDMAKFMIQKGANDFDTPMIIAALLNRINIVKLMIENGATVIPWALTIASKKKYSEIVEYLISKNREEYERRKRNYITSYHKRFPNSPSDPVYPPFNPENFKNDYPLEFQIE